MMMESSAVDEWGVTMPKEGDDTSDLDDQQDKQ
jgi:hypothetical protein